MGECQATPEQSVAASPALVCLDNLSKAYGRNVAVHPINLEIRRGEFLALLGPSGCGKTTLLRLIGGFLKPTTGRIVIGGEDVTQLPPDKRKTNMVFQGYGLFPHMTVRQNIAYGLNVARRPAEEIARRVSEITTLVHLEGLEERLPATLSGGQQQRVALARALVVEPAVLLLDEPLAALDMKLRKAMQEELRQLHASTGGTFVFVTHDQGEAMALASRIILMRDGCIEQEGTPEQIYHSPRTKFAADFVGEANILEGHRTGNRILLAGGISFAAVGKDGPVSLMIRPSEVRCVNREECDEVTLGFTGRVQERVFMGDHVRLTVLAPSGVKLTAHLSDEADNARSMGSEQRLVWNSANHRIIESG